MNEKDDIQLRNTIKEMIELKIKSNFAALALEYWCDYRSSKIRYYEELNKEKMIMKDNQNYPFVSYQFLFHNYF